MSFASQAREEIAQHSLQLQKDCCVRAAAYGIACFAKYFDAKGLVLQTEQELTARGHELVDFESPADAYIINTCSVTAVRRPGHHSGKEPPQRGGVRVWHPGA